MLAPPHCEGLQGLKLVACDGGATLLRLVKIGRQKFEVALLVAACHSIRCLVRGFVSWTRNQKQAHDSTVQVSRGVWVCETLGRNLKWREVREVC